MTTTKQNWKLLASAAMVSLALSGCGSDGSDGSNGEDGKPGPVGVAIGEVTELSAKVTSATVDADGVALAGIQGLSELVKEKDAKIEALERRLERLERVLGEH